MPLFQRLREGARNLINRIRGRGASGAPRATAGGGRGG